MEWKVVQGRGSASLSVNYARVFTWEGPYVTLLTVVVCIETHKVSLIRDYMKIVLLLNSLLVILATF